MNRVEQLTQSWGGGATYLGGRGATITQIPASPLEPVGPIRAVPTTP